MSVPIYVFIPDCKRPGCWQNLYILTILSSVICIGVTSYVLVWMMAIVGKFREGVPDPFPTSGPRFFQGRNPQSLVPGLFLGRGYPSLWSKVLSQRGGRAGTPFRSGPRSGYTPLTPDQDQEEEGVPQSGVTGTPYPPDSTCYRQDKIM